MTDELRREIECIIKDAFGELASDLPTRCAVKSILTLIRKREIEIHKQYSNPDVAHYIKAQKRIEELERPLKEVEDGKA